MSSMCGIFDMDKMDPVQPMSNEEQVEYLDWMRMYFSGLTGGQQLDSFLLGVILNSHNCGYNMRIDDENNFDSEED